MPESTDGLASLAGARPQLVLRYLKHRWLRDIADLLEHTGEDLPFDDIDLDNDIVELTRAAGLKAMTELSLAILARRAPILPGSPALEALLPELTDARAETFLHLVATNLAFRLRSDELLTALATHCAEGVGPRLPASQLGQLLVRARSVAAAKALLEASSLTDAQRAEALAACVPIELDLSGARIHVEADHPSLELALERCLRDLRLVAWTHPMPDTRRLLALRRRGGFCTLLEEGPGNPPAELARELARNTAIGRVAWVSVSPEETQFLILDGTRTVLDMAKLEARLGRPPALDDIAGELRALGVLDLDPAHPRGAVKLGFEAYLRHRKKGIKAMAFGQL